MKLKRFAAVFFAVVILLLGAIPVVMADDNPPPDGFDSWDAYFNSLLNAGDESVEVPPLQKMTLVGENDRYRFYYHEAGVDAYLLDKKTNKLWSTAIHPDYMDTSGMNSTAASLFLEAGVADAEGAIQSLSLTDAKGEFTVTPAYQDGKLSLAMELPRYEIAFTVVLQLDDTGFTCSVPISELRETGKFRLVTLQMLPLFGAAAPKEKGYIFYPDGSGALVEINEHNTSIEGKYAYSLYGNDEQNIDNRKGEEEQDIKNMQLPVLGMKQTNGGFFAAVTEGAETGTVHVNTGKVYQAYFQFDYRNYTTVSYNFTGNSYGVNTITELIPNRMDITHTVKYFLLDESNSSYSDMAVIYRNSLLKQGVLQKQKSEKEIPLSLDFFMGINKQGLLFDNMAKLTTFEDAEKILGDLKKSGVHSFRANLTGWGKGGYDTLPTMPKPESALGGSGGLAHLAKYCVGENIPLSLAVNYFYVDKDSGKFNVRNDVLRDWLGKPLSNKAGNLFILDAARILEAQTANAEKKLPESVHLNFQEVGRQAVSNFNRNGVSSRVRVIDTYRKVLSGQQQKQKESCVSGGNQYVLPYAEHLYDIADTDSKYYQNQCAVPFYQMVVHGYMSYSSVAGNTVYSPEIQKLKWIETGSTPHFILTEKSPVSLKDTNYNKLFSSQYAVWKDSILKIYQDMNQRLAGVWGQTIDKHELINDTVVRLTYGDGSKTYINYGDQEITIDGQKVGALDYHVMRP